MFPSLTDMIRYITGINLPLPVQTFGFFMACGFAVGALLLYNSLRRQEALGQLQPSTIKVTKGGPLGVVDLIVSFIVGFVLGYKLLHGLLNYSACVANPQAMVLSTEGNLIGGIILGLAMAGQKWYQHKQEALPDPITTEEEIWPHQRTGDLIMVAAASGILGAKLLYHLEAWDEFTADPIGSLLSFSGLTWYGGLIGATIVLYFYTRAAKIPLKRLADAAAPSLIMGYGIGRLGCHFAGDGCWGIINSDPDRMSFLPDWLWAYTYPNNVSGDGVPIEGCDGKYCRELAQGVYPTAVYEFLMAGTICVILLSLRSRVETAGLLFSIYLIFNGLERFFIEFVRVNIPYTLFGITLTMSQFIAIGIILLGMSAAAYLISQSKKDIRTA